MNGLVDESLSGMSFLFWAFRCLHCQFSRGKKRTKMLVLFVRVVTFPHPEENCWKEDRQSQHACMYEIRPIEHSRRNPLLL